MTGNSVVNFMRGVGLIAFIAAVPLAHAQSPEPPATARATTVAAVSEVTARNSAGLIKSFSDDRGRLFDVTYDDLRRVKAVRTPGGLNRADVLAIDYAADGRLVGAALGDGNVLVYSYDPDGTQYVQDRYGAVLRRRWQVDRYVLVAVEDPSGTLKGAAERFDALLHVLTGMSQGAK